MTSVHRFLKKVKPRCQSRRRQQQANPVYSSEDLLPLRGLHCFYCGAAAIGFQLKVTEKVKMFTRKTMFIALAVAISAWTIDGLGLPSTSSSSSTAAAAAPSISTTRALHTVYSSNKENDTSFFEPSRRNVLVQGLAIGSSFLAAGSIHVEDSLAAVGSLPEFGDTDTILQGLTVNVADQSQQKSMNEFLIQGLGFEVLRRRINGPVEETVSKSRTFVHDKKSSFCWPKLFFCLIQKSFHLCSG